MANKKITFRLQGGASDKGDVLLNIFIDKLRALKNALHHTERLVSGTDKQTVYYKIVDARHTSPLTITLEAAPMKAREGKKPSVDYSDATVDRFFKNLRAIKRRKIRRGEVDLEALDAYCEIGSMLGEDLSEIEILNGDVDVKVDPEFVQNIRELLGTEEIEYGSISGMLEALNVHEQNLFYIYPFIGTTRVSCTFRNDLRDKVKSAVMKHVRVRGQLKFKPTDRFPYSADVTEIEELKDEKDLPTLSSLKGIAPNATGDLSAEDYIREVRDASW